jgi:hypothetical protein
LLYIIVIIALILSIISFLMGSLVIYKMYFSNDYVSIKERLLGY